MSHLMRKIEALLRSRAGLRPAGPWFHRSPEAEGGCGVTGFACTIPVGGRHIYEPSIQMRNRGNGKGGGIAACGLVAEELGVSRKVLQEDYVLQVALLDASARGEVEKDFIEPCFDVDQGGMVPTVDDYRDVPLLEVRPPDVARYFVRVKPGVLARFAREKGLDKAGLAERDVEDELVYQNSIRLNNRYYASLGDKRAFVMSHARNLIILKIVGYAEAAVQYYRMPDTRAHVWIAHQRYPTNGRVWHPGGAHPCIGLICSEKQAIDATLASLASVDPRFTPVADVYWNARGGSHTDGGAFLMTVSPEGGISPEGGMPSHGAVGGMPSHGAAVGRHACSPDASRRESMPPNVMPPNANGHYRLRVTNKFGVPVATVPWQVHCNLSVPPAAGRENGDDAAAIQRCVHEADPQGIAAIWSTRCSGAAARPSARASSATSAARAARSARKWISSPARSCASCTWGRKATCSAPRRSGSALRARRAPRGAPWESTSPP